MQSHTAPAKDRIDLSAVVIARNEEGNIVDCLEAVFRALDKARSSGVIGDYEVFLVDSASEDRTVQLAARFPVTIIRLRADWPLSAAAGKAVGSRFCRGRVIFFVDGDYILDESWIPKAWTVLQTARVGGICGWDHEQVTGATLMAKGWDQVNLDNVPELFEVDSIASGLLRRDAFDGVGGLQPYLRGAEDRDLGLRMIDAGWRVLKTRAAMGTHRWARSGEPFTYVEYFRSVAVWSLGDGQACRLRWKNPRFRRAFLSRYATMRYLIQDLQFLALVLLLLANAAALHGGFFVPATLLLDLGCLAILGIWGRARHRTMREALFDLQGAIYGPFRQLLFAIGLLRRTPPPESYPRDVEILRGPGPASQTAAE